MAFEITTLVKICGGIAAKIIPPIYKNHKEATLAAIEITNTLELLIHQYINIIYDDSNTLSRTNGYLHDEELQPLPNTPTFPTSNWHSLDLKLSRKIHSLPTLYEVRLKELGIEQEFENSSDWDRADSRKIFLLSMANEYKDKTEELLQKYKLPQSNTFKESIKTLESLSK